MWRALTWGSDGFNKSGMKAVILVGWLLVVRAWSSAYGSPMAEAATNVVTYEAFGAVGDGVTDDLPAIRDAHAYANQHGLRVQSNPQATYHLGHRALTAIITTETDWGTSRFIIDDSQGVEDHAQPLFEVRSRLMPLPLKVDRLTRGQARLKLKPSSDCLVLVENKNRKAYIRRGLNQNEGSAQKEVFILRRDGSIEGGIDWDYDVVTRVEAQPMDAETLKLRGGVFISIANRMLADTGCHYWARNIRIRRSRTEVERVVLQVIGETDVGSPYGGFLNVEQCADITLRNCVIAGRKTYQTMGQAGKPVSMGSYGYLADLVLNFKLVNCRMEDIHDRKRWGVIGSNFMKNILVEDCVLSRMDVHMGVSGDYIIRRSTLGHAGLNAVGKGRLIVEDSTLYGGNLIRFREDYGSTWDGEVLIRNSRWIPPVRQTTRPVMFGLQNGGTHNFGYPCSMPHVIRIEGLFVDDSNHPGAHLGIAFLGDPGGAARDKQPFPYHWTERIEVRDLKIASGVSPRVCSNPAVTRAVKLVQEPDPLPPKN